MGSNLINILMEYQRSHNTYLVCKYTLSFMKESSFLAPKRCTSVPRCDEWNHHRAVTRSAPLAGKSVASLPGAGTVHTCGRWRLTLFGYVFLASSGEKTVQETLRKRHNLYLYYTTMVTISTIMSISTIILVAKLLLT